MEMDHKREARLILHDAGGKDVIYQKFSGHIEYPVFRVAWNTNDSILLKFQIPDTIYPHSRFSGYYKKDVFTVFVDMIRHFDTGRDFYHEYGWTVLSKALCRNYFFYGHIFDYGVLLPRQIFRIKKGFHARLLSRFHSALLNPCRTDPLSNRSHPTHSVDRDDLPYRAFIK